MVVVSFIILMLRFTVRKVCVFQLCIQGLADPSPRSPDCLLISVQTKVAGWH